MRLTVTLILILLTSQILVLFSTNLVSSNRATLKVERETLDNTYSGNTYYERKTPNFSSSENHRNKLFTKGEIEKVGWMDPYFDLVAHWAPVIVQYVESDGNYGYSQDYITNFDYDGDWIGSNNWENFDYYYNSLGAYVYYAVIESETHYFIFYALFHPRDWSKLFDAGADEHENDMEAVMFVIYKSGSPYGTLQVMMSRAHFDFNMYVADPAIGSGIDSVDGNIIFDTFENWRPKIFVEAQGHGIYGSEGEATSLYSYSSYLVYRFNNNISEIPGGGDSNVSYALIPIQRVLWPKALDPNFLVYAGGSIAMYDVAFTYQGYRYSLPFNLPKAFDGNPSKSLMGSDKANPPWGMHNSSWDNYGIHLGDWFFDPAIVVNACFDYPQNYDFSLNYVYNPYITGQIPEETYPALTVYSPMTDVYYNVSSINISWYAYDDTSIRFVQVYFDDALIGTFDGGSHYILVSVADGWHNVTILAVDYWGNYRKISRTFVIDTTPPTISALAPRNNSLLGNSSVELSANLSDNIELERLLVYANDTLIFNVSVRGKTQAWSGNHNFDDGVWKIEYVLLDKVGHKAFETVYVTIDTTPPTINIIEPYNGSLTGNITIIVKWFAHDMSGIDHYEAYLDSTFVGNYSANINSLEINIGSTGWHNITIVAFDILGFSSRETIQLYVDHDSPEVIIYSPWNNDYVPAIFTVEWGGYDDYGVKYYEVYINGSFYARTSNNNINIQLYQTNRYRIDVVAYDYAGNTGSAYVVIMYDKEPPTIIFNEENGSVYVDSTVTIAWTSQDNFEIDKREVSVDNGSYFQVQDDSVSLIFQAGKHWIRVKVYDKAGNTDTSLLIIYVDLSSPGIQITWPYNNSYLSQAMITIKWIANDDTEIAAQSIKINTRTYSVDPEAREFSITLNDAWYTIELIVRDIANRTSIYRIHIVIDTYRPDLTINFPNNYSRFVSNITVSWFARDQNSGVKEVDVYLNNSLVGSYGEYGTIDISNLRPGAYIVRVRALDNAGNKNEAHIIVYIAFLRIISPQSKDNVSSSEINIRLNYLYVPAVNLYVNGSKIGIFSDLDNITINLSDGIWNITIVDPEMQDLRDFVVFRVDTEAPNASIICDTITNKTDIVFSWSANDSGSGVKEVKLLTNNSVYNLGVREGSITLMLNEGVWNLTLYVKDFAGNVFVLSKYVIVDLSAPEIFVSVRNNTIFDTVYINISWTSNDALSGVSSLSLYLDGQLVAEDSEGNLTLMLEDGNHTIAIVVRDRAGNSKRETIVFSVDAPAVIIIEGVANGSYYSSSNLEISWSVFNGEANSTHVYLNGTELGVNWDPSGGVVLLQNLSEGYYVLSIEVKDDEGIVHAANYVFIVDVTPPNITILYPEDNYVTNSSRIAFEVVVDDNFGLKIAYVIYNGTNLTISDSSVILELFEGLNKITFVAVDRAGNKALVERRVYVDKQVPAVELLSPSRYVVTIKENSTLNISWVATDNYGLDRIEIYMGDKLYVVLPPNYTETSVVVHNNVTIIIKVFDLAGNSNQVEINVIVRNEENSQVAKDVAAKRVLTNTEMTLIAIVVVSIIVLLSVVTLLRKKRSREAIRDRKITIEVNESEFDIKADFDREEVDEFFL